MAAVKFIRVDEVARLRARSRAQVYFDIRDGRLTPPVRLGGGHLSAWPEHEIDLLNRAEMAGATLEQVQELVAKLIEQRKGALVAA